MTEQQLKTRAIIANTAIKNFMEELMSEGYNDDSDGMDIMKEALDYTSGW